MIDREARENLAERLRKLASGAVTNFEFESRERRSKIDAAICEIEWLLAWRCYDDFKEHRLNGVYALSDGARKDFARAVLFLKGDCEYRWPRRTGLEFVKRILSLGYWKRTFDNGDVRFWPFFSRSEYEAGLKRHPYLRGSRKVANQLPDPTSPSVTPPAVAGGAPSVAADH